MHDSQDPPEVFYNDNRPFYEKLVDNNTCVNYCNVYLEKIFNSVGCRLYQNED